MRIFIVFKKRRELFTVEDYLQNVCQGILRKVKFLQLEVCPKTYHQLYMSKVLPQSCMHKEAKSRCLEENFTFQAKERFEALQRLTRSYKKYKNRQCRGHFQIILTAVDLLTGSKRGRKYANLQCSEQCDNHETGTRHPTKLQPINSSS